MRFNVPNQGISVPKFTDEWPRKLAVLATMSALVYFLPSEYRVAFLAIIAAIVYINDEDLRMRACMVNVMDNQLVCISADVENLKVELQAVQDELRRFESHEQIRRLGIKE